MKVIRDLESLTEAARHGAVAIGNFDGVHLGHARIVEQLVKRAREVAGPAVVFTFDPHPVRLLRPEQCPLPLTWTERKAKLLVELGVDWMIAYPTDEALLRMSPEEFFSAIVLEKLAARAMVEGPNFFFGHDRSGTIQRLGQLTAAAGIALDVAEPYLFDGQTVSSSRIRERIAAGAVQEARAMLTQPYRIRGMVTHGAGRGAKIGFPTANVHAVDTLLPGDGVYAGRAWINDSTWPAAINIGANPTFDEQNRKVEAHLIGWDSPLYGKPLELDFWQRLRDIQPFASSAELVEQLKRDVMTVQQVVQE